MAREQLDLPFIGLQPENTYVTADAVDSECGGMHLAVKGLVNELYLDDLRDKTHRGLSGSVARGLSAGGRIFGYRTVPVTREAKPTDRGTPARFAVDAGEAEIVREIFRAYAQGRSMKAIAQDLNQRRVPFPAKDTRRGPVRLGWAVSTIRVILRNEKYAGVWVWNKTRFLKDPDSGRRRPVRRPVPVRNLIGPTFSILPRAEGVGARAGLWARSGSPRKSSVENQGLDWPPPHAEE